MSVARRIGSSVGPFQSLYYSNRLAIVSAKVCVYGIHPAMVDLSALFGN
jgi:hypothetical protein